MTRFFWRRFFPQKIAAKLAFVIGTLVLLLLAILGVVLTQITGHVLKRDIRQHQEALVIRAAREISLFVNRPLELLETGSTLIGRIHGNAWVQETVLVEMSLNFPMFEKLASVNLSGWEIASSNPGQDYKNRIREEAFQESRKGKKFVSPIRVGSDYLPHVTMAVPCYRMGKITSVIIAEVNLRGLWDIVDGIKIGKTGKAMLVSEDGLLIAHPDKTRVLRNENWSHYTYFQQLARGKVGSSETKMPSGVDALFSYAPVEGPLPVLLFIQMETREAYQLLERMRFLVWFLLSLSLLVSIVVSVILSRWFLWPVRSLQQWSKRVAVGDFDYEVRPSSSDELGRLLIHFRRMSKRLKQAREKERLAALGEAATTISHKLKNSIVSLKTFSQLLPHRRQDAHFMQKFEEIFSSTVDNLERMFKNLSQVASSRRPNIESVAVDEVLESIRESYADTMERMNIDCQMEITAELPRIQGDPEQLKELFVNLIQNAIHAMPKGGSLVIGANYARPSAGLQIFVTDNGTGIRTQDLVKIFKPFFTTKHGGMGLGLSISKKILESHAGTLNVVSMEGKGSTFTVTLPLQTAPEIEMRHSEEIQV